MQSAKSRGVQGGRVQRLLRKIWWLHSFFCPGVWGRCHVLCARGTGPCRQSTYRPGTQLDHRVCGVSLYRRSGQSQARRALRKKGRAVGDQLRHQADVSANVFFLVPLYASSAMWSLLSPNWWIVAILLTCAVLSTMDLVFDNFIMEHRNLAAGMYGLCMFAVLNLLLPLTFHVSHFLSLMTAAAITPMAVALLSYPISLVFRPKGLGLVVLSTSVLCGGCFWGRSGIPPAPITMVAAGIGHGIPGSYECIPGPVRKMERHTLDGLRCVTEVSEPGGLNDQIEHVWLHRGKELQRVIPEGMSNCGADVFRSELPAADLPNDVTGRWSCRVETVERQLVGFVSFSVPKSAAKR